MKTSKKALALALAAAMAFTGIPATNAEAASKAKLSATKATIYVGGSKTVSVKAPSTWKSVAISTVSSNKKSVATVKKASSKSFKVTAVKAGTAKVTVKVSYKTSTKKNAKKYTKTLAFTANVKSTTLTAKPGKSTLYIGETTKVTAKAVPSSAKITYATGDKKIATVDSKGKIKAVKAGKVTIAAYAKYGTKKVRKAFTITVKEPAVTATLKNSTLAVGEKATLDVTKTPSGATLAFKSSDDTVATVSVTGEITAVKAGTATITTTLTYKGTTKKVTTDVTVKEAVAQLTAVKQTASNAFVATFSAKTPQYTKDDITVKSADGSIELPVKSVEYAADGLNATVTLLSNFTDATAYKIACKDATLDLTAKVGAVSSIAITTASAEKNVATPIKFTLFDKDNIDVTSSISIDTTCNVSISGTYSSAELDKASQAKVTMANVGDTVDVTVTYDSNVKDAQPVTATQKINCIGAQAVKGEAVFASTGDTNTKSGCAKFYTGLSDKTVSVEEGGNAKPVYFCAKQDAYEAVSYDSYEVESANDTIASASVSKDSGKYAVISVQGNTVGTTQLNVKAIKNDQPTYYTIPVEVTKKLKAVKMTVEIDRPVMSNVADPDYKGTITAKLFNQAGDEVTTRGDYQFEVTSTVKENVSVTPSSTDGKATVVVSGAAANTYSIKVTASDSKGDGETFTKTVNVQVKKLPAEATTSTSGAALTYQIEMNRTVLDEASKNKDEYTLKPRLYATCNGLFAGYVRDTNGSEVGGITVASGSVFANEATVLSGATVAAKFGTKVYSPGALYGAVTGGYEPIDNTIYGNGSITGNAVGPVSFGAIDVTTNGAIEYKPDGSSTLAKEGTYTLEYRLYYGKDNNTKNELTKYVSKTNVFTVKNSMVKPTVAVITKNVDDLEFSTIFKKAIKTNVDMNNNDVETDSSFVGLYKNDTEAASSESTTTGQKMIVKYAVVEDNHEFGGNTSKWYFYIPINTTFKTE